jgi:CRISPR-associated endonuclease/helicase Cas3
MVSLPPVVQSVLPTGTVSLAALHDIGKITIGFQSKCAPWVMSKDCPKVSVAEASLSVTDHAWVSQAFLQQLPEATSILLWAVAVGAHHGRPKGRRVYFKNKREAHAEWANENRTHVMEELLSIFGSLPSRKPDPQLAPHHSDLWLLAGLISVADWIGSNEIWFSPRHGLKPEDARKQARQALSEIGLPGGTLRKTEFSVAFRAENGTTFEPNPLQLAVSNAAVTPGIIVVEGPMGCGKTEAALFAAQQLIASGGQKGIYFALPTQVTSNRIHKRVDRFLRNTLVSDAPLRLAHGNAWLEEDFYLKLSPAFSGWKEQDGEDPRETVHVARTWFASAKQALLAPYGVGTVDQALQAIVAVKHFFVRRFALAGKVVILDEVHSYDIYTGTLITALIRELISLRCSVIILSATLTASRRRELLEAAGVTEKDAPNDYPLVSCSPKDAAGICQHISPEWPQYQRIVLRPAVISEEVTISELVTRAEAGQHVLWIRNTVVEAQASFRKVLGSISEGEIQIGLLHSRFPYQRRAELEEFWLERLGKNRPTSGPGSILIATQVVEQSVDIDLDFIVSDLAPTDMLLQRLGRLWRHARTDRQAETPDFWVRISNFVEDASSLELKKSLGRSARVYAPYVLLRTAAVWLSRTEIDIPKDIRPLLEETYAEPDIGEPTGWSELHIDLEKEKAQLASNAEAATRVLANPMLPDREELLTRRKGPPTKRIILLRRAEPSAQGLTLLTALDGSHIEISDYEWSKSAARFLNQWSVRCPLWMVPVGAECPDWLALHGLRDAFVALVHDDGGCVFGEEPVTMSYNTQFGVFAAPVTQSSKQQWNDDEDEFDY